MSENTNNGHLNSEEAQEQFVPEAVVFDAFSASDLEHEELQPELQQIQPKFSEIAARGLGRIVGYLRKRFANISIEQEQLEDSDQTAENIKQEVYTQGQLFDPETMMLNPVAMPPVKVIRHGRGDLFNTENSRKKTFDFVWVPENPNFKSSPINDPAQPGTAEYPKRLKLVKSRSGMEKDVALHRAVLEDQARKRQESRLGNAAIAGDERTPRIDLGIDEAGWDTLDHKVGMIISKLAHDEKERRGIVGNLPTEDFMGVQDVARRKVAESLVGSDAEPELISQIADILKERWVNKKHRTRRNMANNAPKI